MIIRKTSYTYDKKVDEMLGVYMEYALNDDYLCICKWTNQMNEETINDTTYIRNNLKALQYSGYAESNGVTAKR